MRQLDYDQGAALTSGAQHTAFHLELRDSYNAPYEVEELARWQAGEDSDLTDWFKPWTELVRANIDHGVVMRRVRVVTEPLSSYSAWLHHNTKHNIAAGEDVRWLPRHLIDPERLCADDLWLIDDRIVVYSLFDADDDLMPGFAATEDAGLAAHYLGIWNILWDLAVPHAEYSPVVA